MNIPKTVIFVMMSLTSFVALGQTQGEMNRQACDEYKKVDAELNRLYRQTLSQYGGDALFIRKARAAQRAWIVYRDAQMDMLYPNAGRQGVYGSVYPMCRCTALMELTKKRVEELRRWSEGVEEGDVCSGSIRIRSQGAARSYKPKMHYRQESKNRYAVVKAKSAG